MSLVLARWANCGGLLHRRRWPAWHLWDGSPVGAWVGSSKVHAGRAVVFNDVASTHV